MTAQRTSRTLEAIVRTLCGTSESDFLTKQRRFFQLKCWLLDDSPDDLHALTRADRLFAALYIRNSIFNARRTARRSNEPAKVSEIIVELLEDNKIFREMVDRGFSSDLGFSSLSEITAIAKTATSPSFQAKVLSVNTHTECCLRLHISGFTSVKTSAEKLYRLSADLPKSELRKDIRTLRTDLRQRLAFLYVFDRNRDFLQFPSAVRELWTALEDHAQASDSFKKIFSRCAMVQGVIARGKDITRADLERWSGRVAAPPPAFLKPVGDEELRVAHEHFELQEGR